MRIALVLVVALVALPLAAFSSATTPTAATPATLVEGHTVHATMGGAATVASGNLLFKSAPADQALTGDESVFPGVRWFNDQYAITSLASANEPRRAFATGIAVLVSDTTGRVPCTGALFMVDSGSPDPRGHIQQTYVESYLVTDPNDRSWNVDRWTTDAGGDVFTVAILDNLAGYDVYDDGVSNCSPVHDGVLAANTGDNGLAYPGRETLIPGAISYNAYIVTFFEDLHVAGAPIDHHSGGAGRASGALAGNSHAFDPLPSALRPAASFHGGSDGAALATHATRQVDLYYGATEAPVLRQCRLLDAQQGSVSSFGGNPP